MESYWSLNTLLAEEQQFGTIFQQDSKYLGFLITDQKKNASDSEEEEEEEEDSEEEEDEEEEQDENERAQEKEKEKQMIITNKLNQAIITNPEIVCPLTNKIFEEPLTANSCFHTFEKQAILEYLNGGEKKICPVKRCHSQIITKDLERDTEMEKQIQLFLQKVDEEAQAEVDDDDGDESSYDESSEEESSSDEEWCCGISKPDEDYIQCENSDCPNQWYHLGCVGLSKAPSGKWFCDLCRGDLFRTRDGSYLEREDMFVASGTQSPVELWVVDFLQREKVLFVQLPEMFTNKYFIEIQEKEKMKMSVELDHQLRINGKTNETNGNLQTEGKLLTNQRHQNNEYLGYRKRKQSTQPVGKGNEKKNENENRNEKEIEIEIEIEKENEQDNENEKKNEKEKDNKSESENEKKKEKEKENKKIEHYYYLGIKLANLYNDPEMNSRFTKIFVKRITNFVKFNWPKIHFSGNSQNKIDSFENGNDYFVFENALTKITQNNEKKICNWIQKQNLQIQKKELVNSHTFSKRRRKN
ncbi:hypothetical protein M0813_10957 [Anaeramoeba flamelloides]|uniref:Zinc finger, FYVE/PHD-type n=1 Tax=Anaeramoeba flamelloides TaxID=1746091 RepID=A0ABQ8X164_9EUKA|nr:hypothetical protein M0813_10957 [Anaeramoeba flamelloides]